MYHIWKFLNEFKLMLLFSNFNSSEYPSKGLLVKGCKITLRDAKNCGFSGLFIEQCKLTKCLTRSKLDDLLKPGYLLVSFKVI